MRKSFLLVVFMLSTMWLSAQRSFTASSINPDLRENADAVIRLHTGHFTIKSMDQAIWEERKVVTIFNKDADNLAFVGEVYDKLTKIVEFDAVVYDASGKLIKKLRKDDIIDQSYISGFSLYEDNRVRGADLSQKTYPYTVDFSVKLSYKYLYSIRDWEVLRFENVAVEKSIFHVSAPEDLKPRFKALNVANDAVVSYDGKTQLETSKWVFENLPAQEYEPYSNQQFVDNPQILVSPSKFLYEGYEGGMSSWDDLAKWQLSLNENRNDLSETAKAKVRELVKGAENDEEKIKRIYEYMQNRTRYVSIQLGIGGLQPFPNSMVETKGYGDCKALSFYTQSLLAAVEIPSFYTKIENGSNPLKLDREFVNPSFNHIILCVPNKGDTLWLECTSQTAPMGYIGVSNSDRDVLLVTPEGGKIVRTPKYQGANNQYITRGEVAIDIDGNASSNINMRFVGGATDNGAREVIYQNNEIQKEWLQNLIDVPSYELNNYHFEETKSRIPEVDLQLDMTIRKVASVSGNRLLLQPNLFSARSFVPKAIERKSPIEYELSRLESDTLNFSLPEGAYIEQLPEKIEINSDFADYSAEFLQSQGQLQYIRSMQYHPGTYDAEKYPDLIHFYKSVRRADRKKVIISVKT